MAPARKAAMNPDPPSAAAKPYARAAPAIGMTWSHDPLYLYLFANVAGSLSIKLGFPVEHPATSALIALGGVVLLLLLRLARFSGFGRPNSESRLRLAARSSAIHVGS
jgi:hypothetical protein